MERLLEDLRATQSCALVLRGEAGVGKTALLEHLLERAEDCRLVRAVGLEPEMELAFSALHQVCAPLVDQLTRLPPPQREALSTALGLSAGRPPDRFMVGVAVLGLLAEVARERPLLCVIDDAQWLDRVSAQVLAFVARRLRAESVAMIFAVRETSAGDLSGVPDLAGLPQLMLAGLPDRDARALLLSTHRVPFDDRVVERILAETRSNPLALQELPRAFASRELSAGLGTLGVGTLPQWIEESYQRQIEPLPPDSRQLLLVAAIEPLGDPVRVLRAAERLGVRVDAAGPPVAAELLELGARVHFRHPLLRSAVYRAASPEQRRAAHRALAQVTDPRAEPDQLAWHAAQAAAGPDENLAADVERCAVRARSRGGVAAAAAFLELATDLSVDLQHRGRRALTAAQLHLEAGQSEASLRLLSLAEASSVGRLHRAGVQLLRARITFTMNRGADAPAQLLRAATELEPLDTRLARDTYLEALDAARFAAHLANGAGLREVAEAARAVAPAESPSAADLLLDGLALRFTDGCAASVPTLKRAVTAFQRPDLPMEDGLRWLWLASTVCTDYLWDDQSWEILATRHVQLVRDAGALAMLPHALMSSIAAHICRGELAVAADLFEEQKAVAEATGAPLAWHSPLFLAAWQGREAETFQLIEGGLAENRRRGEGNGVIVCGLAKGLLCNSLGRYEESLAATQEATDYRAEVGMAYWASLVELITAAARIDRPELGTDAFQRLRRQTQAAGTDWALGLESRCQALLSDGSAAESAYQDAIHRLARSRARGELARTHLHYGEWLRRQNRRLDAREHLRAAHQTFTAIGAEIFAERAAGELAATGETVRKRSAAPSSELTGQETQIVRLVREGLSNAEIAGRLFISPRTVEWHLGKVFAKLQITSRRQLRR